MDDIFISADAESLKTFCDALIYSNDHLHDVLIFPKALMRWPFNTLAKVRQAFERVDQDMKTMLKNALEEGNEKKGEGK